MTISKEEAMKELARRELARRQQAASTQAPQPQVQPQQAQDPSLGEKALQFVEDYAGENLAAYGAAAGRSFAKLPQAAVEIGSLLSTPFTGIDPKSAPEAFEQTAVGSTLKEYSEPTSPTEKRLAADNPYMTFAGDITAPIVAGPRAVANAPRVAQAAFQGGVGSQLMTFDSPEERITAGLEGIGYGVLGDRLFAGLGKLTGPLAKYVPGTDKTRLAAKDIAKTRGGAAPASAADESAMFNRTEKLMGTEAANRMSLYDITGDIRVENKAKAFALSQTEEGAQMIKEAADLKQKAVAKAMQGYRNTLRLNKAETDNLNLLQNKVLPQAKVSAGDYNKITSDPLVANNIKKLYGKDLPEYQVLEDAQSRLKDLQADLKEARSVSRLDKAKSEDARLVAGLMDDIRLQQEQVRRAKEAVTSRMPEEAILFRSQVEGHSPQSAFFMDKLRRRLMTLKTEAKDPSVAASYQKSIDKIDDALAKPVDELAGQKGAYNTMKGLQQREIMVRDLDAQHANVGKTLDEGRLVDSVSELKKVYSGANMKKLMEAQSRIKDPAKRKEAKQVLNYIRTFVNNVDDEAVQKNLGRAENASVEGGGLATLVVKPVGKFMRGEYNKEVAYLIDNPSEYVKQLQAIERNETPEKALMAFARVLGAIQGAEFGEEDRRPRMEQQQ